MKLSSCKLVVVLALAFFTTSCKKTVRESSETLKAGAVFMKVLHVPQHNGMKFGYHLNFRGKMVFGTYLGTIPEENSTTFIWLETGEQFSTSNREICVKFIDVPKGTKVNVSYQNIFDITYDNKNVVEKKYIGLKVLDAEPIN